MNLTTRISDWLRAARLGPLPQPKTHAAIRDRRHTARRSLSIGIVALFALHIGLAIAAESSHYLRDPGYADKEIRLARQEALNPTGPRIVMLGTSRTAAAFHAGRLREQLGSGVVFNFGIPASGPVTHLLYFRRLLAAGHKPDLLILEVLPPTLGTVPSRDDAGAWLPVGGPLESRFFFGNRMTHSELDAVIGYGFPHEVTRQWRESVTEPWYSLRFPLLGRIMPSALPWHLRFDWSRGCDEFGWGAPFKEDVTPGEYAEGLVRSKGEYQAVLADMEPTGGGARALADLAALCRTEGIPLKLILMPEAIGFRAMYSPVVLERLHRQLQTVCRDHGCTLIDAREWLPDSAFTDGHHVLKRGAHEFTDKLMDAVLR